MLINCEYTIEKLTTEEWVALHNQQVGQVVPEDSRQALCAMAFIAAVFSPTHQNSNTLARWLMGRTNTFCELIKVFFNREVLNQFSHIRQKVTTLSNHEKAFSFYYYFFMPNTPHLRQVDNFKAIKDTIIMLYRKFKQSTFEFANDWAQWAVDNGFMGFVAAHPAVAAEVQQFQEIRN